MSEFVAFPKIKRFYNASCVVTEKIDGTNAALVFDEDGRLACQSRKRIITPDADNYGFAAWANARRAELFEFFGPGRHFGEWWGRGVQKRYPNEDGKQFSPFNVGRFRDDTPGWPANCRAVPVLAECVFAELGEIVLELEVQLVGGCGSVASPGCSNPEGLMIWIDGLGYIKHPFDPIPKGVAS